MDQEIFMLTYKDQKFVWCGGYETRHIPKGAGLRWDPQAKRWWTVDPSRAGAIPEQHLDEAARAQLGQVVQARRAAIEQSRAQDADITLPCPEGLEYLPYQRAGIAYALGREGVLIGDEMGLGKAQPLDAKILTPSGWTRMGDVKVGDRVFGSDGLPHRVTGVFPQGDKPVFLVQFTDGAETECCDEHLWQVQTACMKHRDETNWRVLPLAEIRSKLTDAAGNIRHYIPIVQPLQFATKELPVDPYVLGALLGDGGLHGSNILFTSADEEIVAEINRLLPVVRLELKHIKDYDYRLNGNLNPIRRYLKEAGLCVLAHEKFIPESYKFASVEQRIALLQGLMDTDGSVHSDCCTVEFSTTSEQLCDDVQFLIESLGGKAVKSSRVTSYHHNNEKRQGRPSYRLNISFGPSITPFRCSRKASKFQPRSKYPPTRGIASVEPVGTKPCQCIMVDSADHLYVTDHCILTHNTIQAIGAANADSTARSILIVCPASLKLNWQREWLKWDTKGLTVGVANGGTLPETDVVVINYDILGKHRAALRARQWDLLITDEAHYLKTPKTKRTQEVLGHWDKDPKKAIEPIRARRRLFLTGTPIPNRPIELWPLLKSLDPNGLGRNWEGYVKRYCAGYRDKYGWQVDGSSNLPELQEKLRATIMVRRLKADVLTELPPKRRQIIVLPTNGAVGAVQAEQAAWQRHEQRLAELRIAIELAKAGSEAEYDAAVEQLREGARYAFTELSKARHAVALAKVPYVIEHLRETLEQGQKVICFVHHKDVLAAIAGEFGSACVTLTGDHSPEERQAAVDRFQTDPTCTLFIGTIMAAGVGITLTASSHEVFAELDWVPGNLTQAEDRAHRLGQQNSVLVQHLVLDGSLDARMAAILVEKQAVIEAALDREVPEIERVSVLPHEEPATARISRKKVIEDAPALSDEAVEAIHLGLRMLAGVCDGARNLDDAGFNKLDTGIGHSLAAAPQLTQRQAVLGRRLCTKYRRQLPSDLIATINR
jgi:SNF2-related domain/Helicase conserved C-terminal domain/LAGLIDADG-like domain